MYIHAYIYIHVYIYIYTLYIHCRRILSKHYSPTSQHVYIYTHIHIYTFKSDMLHIHCHRILSKSYSPTTHQSASQHRGHSTTHGSMEVSFFPLFFVWEACVCSFFLYFFQGICMCIICILAKHVYNMSFSKHILSFLIRCTHTHAHRSGGQGDAYAHAHTHTSLWQHTHTHTYTHTCTHTHTHTHTYTHTQERRTRCCACKKTCALGAPVCVSCI